MGKKLTYEFVFDEFKKRGYELKEREYKNVMTKMKYICLQHPETEQFIKYNDIKYGHGCRFCGKESQIKKQALNIEEVKKRFLKYNLVLLQKSYINSDQKLECYCLYHPDYIIERSIRDLRSNVACSRCTNRLRLSLDDIKSEFDRRGYTLISKKYLGNSYPLEYICLKHPNEVRLTTWNTIQQGHGCFDCGLEKVRESKMGNNNPNWNGGVTEFNSWLRSCIDVWRKHKRKTLTSCFITGEESPNLEVHHSFSFHKIRDTVLKKLNLEIREKVTDYSDVEIKLIRRDFLALHSKVCAVALRPDIHKLFHKIYGKDVRYSHLKEFKERYERGEFDGIYMETTR